MQTEKKKVKNGKNNKINQKAEKSNIFWCKDGALNVTEGARASAGGERDAPTDRGTKWSCDLCQGSGTRVLECDMGLTLIQGFRRAPHSKGIFQCVMDHHFIFIHFSFTSKSTENFVAMCYVWSRKVFEKENNKYIYIYINLLIFI